MSKLSYIPKNDTWLSKYWKKIVLLITIVAGIVILTWAATQTMTRIHLETEGVRVTGQIRSLDKGLRIGSLSSSTVAYSVNGVEYIAIQNFSSSMQIGDSVQLAYDISNPSEVVQVGTLSRGELVLYIVGILTLTVAGFIGFLALRKK